MNGYFLIGKSCMHRELSIATFDFRRVDAKNPGCHSAIATGQPQESGTDAMSHGGSPDLAFFNESIEPINMGQFMQSGLRTNHNLVGGIPTPLEI